MQVLGPPPDELANMSPELNRWLHDLINLLNGLINQSVTLNGTGAPGPTLGNNGYLYVNNTGAPGSRLYAKIAGAWVAIS
jgi:hypothetical protein